MEKQYIAIDLKSFFASVECVERGLDPLTTNLVVADSGRTNKTICLAVTPSLKSFGIPGRPRLFEVVQKVKEANSKRIQNAPGCEFIGKTYDYLELMASPGMAIDYIVAKPRMSYYMEYSARIFDIYLKYVAPEDTHVYSVDEVFMDVTDYLETYKMTAQELLRAMINDVFESTGITATGGVGTNMYLCKIAMDIVAKKMPPDSNGVRIASLDEMSYRKLLWNHSPLTDFWRVGPGYARKLNKIGIYTMGDVARCSLGKKGDYYNEELLYKMFGINAELLIDHAWGYEPTTISQIHAYRPQKRSLGLGQVLQSAYTAPKARLIVKEMTQSLALDLVEKRVVSNQLVLTIGYDVENLMDPERRRNYKGEVTIDRYGREIPKHAHGTINLPFETSSGKVIMENAVKLFDSIVDFNLLIRRINISLCNVTVETKKKTKEVYEQLDLFTNYDAIEKEREQEKVALEREKNMQKAILKLQKKYGKNAVLKGMNLEEGGTMRERNGMIGGHKA